VLLAELAALEVHVAAVAILTDPGGPVLHLVTVNAAGSDRRVAILTDPGGPVLHCWEGYQLKPIFVAILTDPGGPVLLVRGLVNRSGPDDVAILTDPGGPVLPGPGP